MNTPPLLSMRGVSKAFASPVLRGVNFLVNSGEVVALTGENGAGKSTLSKIIAGLVSPDSGEMQLHGAHYAPIDRAAAERAGVRMVLQELGLIGTLSIAENLQLTELPARAGFINRAELNRRAAEQLERVGLHGIDPSLPVSALGIGQQQLVEIARGLMGRVRLLILDEPTAMLTAPEVTRLFEQIGGLKSQGVGVVYVSHRLDELARIADRIVVLRDGAMVWEQDRKPSIAGRLRDEDSVQEIVRAMVGHEPASTTDRSPRAPGRELLRLQGMTRVPYVRNVTLRMHAGEIVGLAGLVGSGRTELLRLIFGADTRDSGEIYLNGSATPARIGSPTQAVANGIGMLTEDRKSEGLLLTQPVSTNVTLANLRAVSRRGWLDESKQASVVRQLSERLRLRARNGEQIVSELSGGNQQKVLFGRWLHKDCQLLLLDEPTRGIDVGARADIHAELHALAAAQKAILMVSSDLRELMEVCDRIAVLSAGTLTQVFTRGEWSEAALLSAAFAAYDERRRAARGGSVA